MEKKLIPTLTDFIKKEKIDLSISEDNPYEFWLDDKSGAITVRFEINNLQNEIFYDVYSPEFSIHLKEETLKDVEYLESLAEENRRWEMVKIIEDIWLILDEIKIWAMKNNFNLMEKDLI